MQGCGHTLEGNLAHGTHYSLSFQHSTFWPHLSTFRMVNPNAFNINVFNPNEIHVCHMPGCWSLGLPHLHVYSAAWARRGSSLGFGLGDHFLPLSGMASEYNDTFCDGCGVDIDRGALVFGCEACSSLRASCP